MREVKLENLDLTLYEEKLENGLTTLYIPYSDKKNYYITYATRYGSVDTTFVPSDSKKEIKYPDGIAHFLEHKMFEQEDGIDPFKFYAETGTGANAATNYTSTQYLCYGTKNFENNLDYLLDYVNKPYFTDENVEKEKGIIIEELKMYEDIPEYRLDVKIKEGLYHVHPTRIDIGGTVSEVSSITKEQLYDCYNTFYQPNNMFLIVAGCFDLDSARKVVHKRMSSVTNNNKGKIKRKTYKEPKSVFKKEEIIHADINIPKVAIAYKFDKKDLGDYDDLTIDLYLSMLTTLIFGLSSMFREKARSNHLMTYFYTEWETVGDYRSLILFAETQNPDLFIEKVDEEIENFKIMLEDLTRMKKVWIANEVKMVDYVETTVNNIYDDFMKYKKVIPNKVSEIRTLNKKDLDSIFTKMNFKNKTVVKLMPK